MNMKWHDDELAAEIARAERGARVRAYIAQARAKVRYHAAAEAGRLAAARDRETGYAWRGWWYPRALVLGLLWLAILVLFGLLVVGLFFHPTLGA